MSWASVAFSRARLAGLCLLLLMSGSVLDAAAQPIATLTGRVADVSGAALPGAAVTVTSVSQPPSRRTVFTDATGAYRVADLAAGPYDITVEIAGFKSTIRRDVRVTPDVGTIDFTLELAGITESVTVLGERAARSLKDTAASVVVFDERALDERPLIVGTTELLGRIPNITATGTNNFAPAVRGVDGTGPAQGADAFFAGTRPRLNVQIDGRPASYNEVIFGDVGLWDIEQVEVYRGAQSTLQGRNAVAGTLMVKTKDPSYRPEVKVRAVGGNLDTRQVSAMVSGPLVDDKIAARFAFDRSTSDSFVDGYTSFPGVEQPGAFESLTLRGKVLFEPDAAKRFSTLVTINHSDVTGPQTEGVLRPFDEHASSFPAMPVFEPRSTNGIIESRWTWSDRVGYEHTLALTDLHVERKAEPGDGNAEVDGRELVFEPRVRFSTASRRVQGFGGIYIFRSRQDESIDLFGGGTFHDETTTVAGFGEAVVTMPKNLSATIGGRLEREHRRRAGADGPFTIDFDQTYNVFSPKLGLAWRASEALTIGTAVSRGYNGGAAGFTYDFPFVSYTFEPEFVWNYETYARADLLEGRMSLTGNAFFSDYKDMQLPFDLNPDPSIWSFVVRNADAAVTYGGEFGATWQAVPSLRLFANFGVLKTEITDYPGSSVEGNSLPQAPAFTTDFGVFYKHSSGVDASIDARYSDAYYSSVTNDPRGKVDPYALVNLQAGYSLSGARIFAFVNNLFDSAAPTLLEPGATMAEDVAMILRPRRAGLGLSWGF